MDGDGDFILEMRKDLVETMSIKRDSIVFRVDGQTLFQSISAPHDLATAEPTPSENGSYARARVLSAADPISVLQAEENVIIYECQTVGDNELTPAMSALMSTANQWEVRQVRGGDFIPAKATRIEPTALGWKVLVEVTAA